MKKWIVFIIAILTINPCFAKDTININYDNGVYHIILQGKGMPKKISFVSSDTLITNKEAHRSSQAKLTINAGFFDPVNQKTISYIVSDNITKEDPHFNENLISNPKYRKNLDKIFNRTEFRVLECSNDKKYRYEIVPHNSEIDFGCIVKTSAQGGPLILPQLRLEEEFFITKKNGQITRESCSVLHKTARTIIGLKNDDVHILIITDNNPMDLYEVQEYCKKLGLEKAMAFDGGSSTSLNYKNEIEVVSTKGDGAGRQLKSFMHVF